MGCAPAPPAPAADASPSRMFQTVSCSFLFAACLPSLEILRLPPSTVEALWAALCKAVANAVHVAARWDDCTVYAGFSFVHACCLQLTAHSYLLALDTCCPAVHALLLASLGQPQRALDALLYFGHSAGLVLPCMGWQRVNGRRRVRRGLLGAQQPACVLPAAAGRLSNTA